MKCFDCKFSVMLMFCLSYRIGRIYICLICKVGATRGCGFLFASACSTLETLDCLFFFLIHVIRYILFLRTHFAM